MVKRVVFFEELLYDGVTGQIESAKNKAWWCE